MKLKALIAATLLLAACDSTTPEERAALREQAAANQATIIQNQARPAISACIGYAAGGPLDVAGLQRAGFTGPNSALVGVSYRGPNLFVALNENRGVCRMTWAGVVSPVSATNALREELSRAGFTQTGQSEGRDVFYSNGTATLSAASIFTTSSGFQALDVVLKRR